MITEKVCLVTGANAGIGKATALGLAQMGATVIMVCRNLQKGQEAQAEIQAATGNQKVDLLVADLALPDDSSKLAERVKTHYTALHVLINNAAIIPQQRTVTAVGWEMQWMVNHLAPFLLTNLLIDLLKQSAPARVVTVASQVHANGRIHFNDLHATQNYQPSQVYANTKLANILFTFELARRLAGSGVTANCLHPGVVATNLLNDYMGVPRQRRDRGIAPTQGAETSLYLATSPEVAEVSGHYFVDKEVRRATAVAYDETLAAQLWQVSAEMLGLP
jgi:NAD(P)-dependent dehydrogenase (short-subunit alcohol dehydrogenase family)